MAPENQAKLVFVALGCVVFLASFGVYIARQKGRSELEGVVFALLLGPVGLIILACLPTHVAPPAPVKTPARPQNSLRTPS